MFLLKLFSLFGLMMVSKTMSFTPSLFFRQHHRQQIGLGNFNRLNVSTGDDQQANSNIVTLVERLHTSSHSFRIVVIGNGAILETTNSLGPVFKAGTSPKTGERLFTFASEDKSFEFHLKVDQIAKAYLTSRPRPDDSEMCIIRMVSEDGAPICSLILQDCEETSQMWTELKDEFGIEIAA